MNGRVLIVVLALVSLLVGATAFGVSSAISLSHEKSARKAQVQNLKDNPQLTKSVTAEKLDFLFANQKSDSIDVQHYIVNDVLVLSGIEQDRSLGAPVSYFQAILKKKHTRVVERTCTYYHDKKTESQETYSVTLCTVKTVSLAKALGGAGA